MELSFVTFDEVFLNESLCWLEDVELRTLINIKPVNPLEQRKWYEALPSRNDYYIWGVCQNRRPIGVVGIKNVMGKRGEYWGYIGDKSLWGKGIGKHMIRHAEFMARLLNITVIELIVLKTNMRAQALYIKSGFAPVEETGEQIKMQKYLGD